MTEQEQSNVEKRKAREQAEREVNSQLNDPNITPDEKKRIQDEFNANHPKES